jgi:hypothetical protein
MLADEMSLEVFNALLQRATFKVLNYPERYAYEGAGDRCLKASVDSLDILYEGGEYQVFGFDTDDESWCVSFKDDGERERLL